MLLVEIELFCNLLLLIVVEQNIGREFVDAQLKGGVSTEILAIELLP